jgi:glycosyltransferase involved in cell wall biosynthesis
VVAADADSETARLVDDAECGIVLPPDRPDLLAGVLRDAHDGRIDLERLGARGREYVVREADRSVALARYRTLIDRLVAA